MRMTTKWKRMLMVVVLAAMGIWIGLPSRGASGGRVIVFHAGSLSVPFLQMEKVFESKHPNMDILREAGGSTEMARMISQFNKPADIMASADVAVVVGGNAAGDDEGRLLLACSAPGLGVERVNRAG